jgi:hypothetical protein
MRLEIPSVGYYQVRRRDTWATIAQELLGAAERADVLSIANSSSPWLFPAEGQEIIVPYNLRVIVAANETIVSVAYKYFGDMNKAWWLDHYNSLGGRKLEAGDVVLVPLTEIRLTEAGKKLAAISAGRSCAEGAGANRELQHRVMQELPALASDVKGGRYLEAVRRGTRFLAAGPLAEPELARVHRYLTEAYVALDAGGLAAGSCKEWLKRDSGVVLDPAEYSPKILAACAQGVQ